MIRIYKKEMLNGVLRLQDELSSRKITNSEEMRKRSEKQRNIGVDKLVTGGSPFGLLAR